MRSGVNCRRLNSRSSDAARALTRSVLATPGTPSSRTWPRTSRATTNAVTTRSWPTIALPTSSRTRRTASLGPSFLDGTAHLPAQGFDLLGNRHQRPLVGRLGAGEHGAHLVRRAAGASGDGVRDLVRRRRRRPPEAVGGWP